MAFTLKHRLCRDKAPIGPYPRRTPDCCRKRMVSPESQAQAFRRRVASCSAGERTQMLSAFALGAATQLSLVLSGLAVFLVKVPKRVVGCLAGFGAGALIAA